METKKKYSWEYLDNCSYRGLQQIAKSLCLPCNFKKIYLKELILAKNVKTEIELNERINYIKLERKNNSASKKTPQKKTSERSNLKNKCNSKNNQSKTNNQKKLMLSPPISITPKRTYVPRRSSPRFKNLFIRYRPKTLSRSSSPKTYSSPRNKVLKIIKKDNIDDKVVENNDKIKNEQNNDSNDTFDRILNDVTPITSEKKLSVIEDLVNTHEVMPPSMKSRITNIIHPSTSQSSYFEEHIKNVSQICCELVSAGQHVEDYPKIEDNIISNENTYNFMDRINNYINRFTQTPENDLKIDATRKDNKNNLPKFADAFANICNLPWITHMQETQENKKLSMDNMEESILNFPDEFGFQNIYNTEGNFVGNDAMQLLETYLDSPEEVGAFNISELIDQVRGRSDKKTNMQMTENVETVHCVICSLIGAKNLLETHIKEKHSSRIHKGGGEWVLKLNLGGLTCVQSWYSEVLQQDSVLYLLSVRYQDPEYCMATLSMLSSKTTVKKYGSITLYNSLTGEPHSWEGEIEPFSTNLPYYNQNRGLKIKLEKLNLLPNSANLKLINRELVNSSLSKVIVGQPELNNIYLMFFVNIL